MTDSASGKQNKKNIDARSCRSLVLSMAMIVHNDAHHYWFSPSDAVQATNACYNQLSGILNDCGELPFRIVNGALLIDTIPIDTSQTAGKFFVRHMLDLEIQNFSLSKGLSREDFGKLLENLARSDSEIKKQGGFKQVIHDAGLKNIAVKRLVFTELGEEEIIVGKSGAGAGVGDEVGEQTVGNILAFLKGEVAAGKQEADMEAVEKLASDPQKMAELILQAAEIRQAAERIEGGESLVDFVVGCLRRTYESMTGAKSAQTKTGRKRITRNLLLLEEEILARMREMSMEWKEEDLAGITDAVEEMTDELKIDSMFDDYATKRRAIEKSEEELLDFIRSRGIEQISDIRLQEKFTARGLGLEGWHELVVKSTAGSGGAGSGLDAGGGAGGGVGAGAGGSGPGTSDAGAPVPGAAVGAGIGLGQLLEALGHLDMLLDSMERQFEKTSDSARQENREQLLKIFAEVSDKLEAVTAAAGARIDQLLNALMTDGEAARCAEAKARETGIVLRLTREEVLSALSGIVQDLCEPLAMIDSALEMIASKTFGEVSKPQGKILSLARKNVQKIKNLLSSLQSISGGQ